MNEVDRGPKLPKLQTHPYSCTLLLCITIIYCLTLLFPGKEIVFQLSNNNSTTYLQSRSPIEQKLFYDYPKAWQLYDTGVKNASLAKTEPLFIQALHEISTASNIPVWQGIYNLLLHPQTPSLLPIPEKIISGEIWRIITPAFLHTSMIHFFINIMWALLLLPGFESLVTSTSRIRFFLLIFLIASFSNTVQFLISGPSFLGFSGVISGVAGYLYHSSPQKLYLTIADGYRVEKALLQYLKLFIFGMSGFAIALFFLDFFHIFSYSIPIANGAHLSGWLFGRQAALQNSIEK